MLIVVCVFAAAAHAAPGYAVSAGSLAYTPLSPATANVVPYVVYPTSAYVAPTGFSMQLFGVAQTSFTISNFGHLHLDPANVTDTGNYDWDSSLVIAPCWAGWGAGTAGVMLWEIQAGVLIVEWQDVELVPFAGSVSFQVRADTATGIIEFRYAPPQGSAPSLSFYTRVLLAGTPTAGSAIPVTFGQLAGFVDADGQLIQWPSDSYIRFTPSAVDFPAITVTVSHPSHSTPQPGVVVNYLEGKSVQSMNMDIDITHPSSAAVALEADLWDLAIGYNLVETEFESASAATSYTISPSTGSLAAGTSIRVVLLANDGVNRSVLSFMLLGETRPPKEKLVDDSGKFPVFNCSLSPAGTSTALAPLACLAGLLLRRRRNSRNS